MSRFRWGIFGTGAISAKFMAGLAAAQDAQIAFVASRSEATAQVLASAFGVPRVVVGYAEAARAGGVDAIYIGTPASLHVEHALLCIEAGVPVLVEKPIANSADGASRIAAAAKNSGVFAMEAMWTRFLPAARALRERVLGGSLGEIRLVSGNFGTSQRPTLENGMFDPVRGGGALSHLSPYPISLAQWLFGEPSLVQSTGTIGATGVDEDAAFQMRFASGVIGSFFVSIRAWAPDDFRVMGAEGMTSFRGSIVRPHGLSVALEPPREPETASLGWKSRLRQSGLVHQMAQRLDRSSRSVGSPANYRYSGNGYHYEADEVRRCVLSGASESSVMPLRDSIAVAAAIDAVRAGIVKEKNGSVGA